MASGQTLFRFNALSHQPPSSNYARPGTIVAATGVRRTLKFVGSDGSVDEYTIFEDVWPSWYDGGGIDIFLAYSTDGTSVLAVEFELSAEIIKDLVNLASGGIAFGTVTNLVDTPGTATADYQDITAAGVISHANCGSPSKGHGFRLKVARDYDHAANTDEVHLSRIHIEES